MKNHYARTATAFLVTSEYYSAGVSIRSAIPTVLMLLSTFSARTMQLLSTPFVRLQMTAASR